VTGRKRSPGGKSPAPRRRSAAGGSDPKRLEEALAGIDSRLALLQAEVALLRERGDPPTRPGGGAGELREGLELLRAALAEVPRAQDFEPLADHLYAFAEMAPRLIEGLESVQKAVGPVEAAAATLGQVVDTLTAIHHSWSESLLRLPRAEDYEPLAAPLREFARVSPALAETLGAVVRAVAPLPDLVAQLQRATDLVKDLGTGARGGAHAEDGLRPAATRAAQDLRAAHEAIRTALKGLPADPAYAGVAAQLRELATVSPSLMEWLRQVPPLSLPLGESVAALDEAAANLEQAEEAVKRALEAPKRGGARQGR
jgi:hypothetical protein